MTATTSTPRKRAAKRTSPKAAPITPEPVEEFDADAELEKLGFVGENGPIGEDGSIRPVKIGQRGRTPNPMVDLFELDGVMYQIPSKPPPMLTFRYQRAVNGAQRIKDAKRRKAATDKATEDFLVSLLGREALDALAESPETEDEDIADVFAIVAHIGFGSPSRAEEAQGNS